jgi:hypothetical protein
LALISLSQIARSVKSCFESICRLSSLIQPSGSGAQPTAARQESTANNLQPVRKAPASDKDVTCLIHPKIDWQNTK